MLIGVGLLLLQMHDNIGGPVELQEQLIALERELDSREGTIAVWEDG
jgi:hypothetical protein